MLGLSDDPLESAGAVVAAPPTYDLQAIYRAHAAFVWRALRSLGVPEAERDDLTHEVFIVAQRRLPEFEGRSKVTTWLFVICQHVASDHRRSARVRRERLVEAPTSRMETAPEAGADADVARRQARGALQTILDGMPGDQRIVFSFFEIDGMMADEIASIVECPVNTVYSRLRLARTHFEREMKRLRRKGWP